MKELTAFRIDGVDTFIAHGREDLSAAVFDHYGESWESMSGIPLSECTIEELDPEDDLKVFTHDGQEVKKVRTWVKETGRGLLCSTEW